MNKDIPVPSCDSLNAIHVDKFDIWTDNIPIDIIKRTNYILVVNHKSVFWQTYKRVFELHQLCSNTS